MHGKQAGTKRSIYVHSGNETEVRTKGKGVLCWIPKRRVQEGQFTCIRGIINKRRHGERAPTSGLLRFKEGNVPACLHSGIRTERRPSEGNSLLDY